MTLHAILRRARQRLAAAGIHPDEAALDADLLARHALGWDRASLVASASSPAPGGFEEAYNALIERRVGREPVAYIRGTQEFWGREFLVRPGVLIPRPETELLVEEGLAWMGERERTNPVRILDIGTGSGCLAVTLALELPGARLSASDVSAVALEVAEANARRLGAAVEFHHGAYLAGAAGPFDLIVSNPPYVTTADYRNLQPEVRDHEPVEALMGGRDGLDVVREVARLAAHALGNAGTVMIEIGYGQEMAVRKMIADTKGLTLLGVRDDLAGIPRVAVAAVR